MGQFSAEKPVAPGSVLSGNQHKRNKRFHVINAKILMRDYDATAEDAPDDDDGVAERRF
jgi:hypothetical protein